MKADRMVKRVVASGNAGGIYVPRKWINQYVVVTLFRVDDFVLDVFAPYMDDILGIYLHGSHARGDACAGSDINVFVVVEKDIPYQKKPGLNAEIVHADALSSYASASPVDYYCMINEAVPLFDMGQLEKMRDYSLDCEKIRKFCKDVERSLRLLDRLMSDGDCADAVYALVCRLRGLYVVHARVRKYAHKGFEEFLRQKGLSGDAFRSLYGVYRAKRDDAVIAYSPLPQDVEMLRRITEKLLKEVKSIHPKAV
jgi:hypothetical protein